MAARNNSRDSTSESRAVASVDALTKPRKGAGPSRSSAESSDSYAPAKETAAPPTRAEHRSSGSRGIKSSEANGGKVEVIELTDDEDDAPKASKSRDRREAREDREPQEPRAKAKTAARDQDEKPAKKASREGSPKPAPPPASSEPDSPLKAAIRASLMKEAK